MPEDPLDLNTLDGRLWDVWSRYPAGPLPEDPRQRDFNAFAAGIKATVWAFIGAEATAENLADTLIASLMMRDAVLGHAGPGRDDAPGSSPGAS